MAQNNLGTCYKDGRGVDKNWEEALVWFRKAAEQGHPSGQLNLGLMYSGGLGVAKDDAEAAAWYRKAAEQGEAQAQNNLGSIYQSGRGVPQDDAEALRWYLKAAQQNLAIAQRNAALLYWKGKGTEQDYIECVHWFRKAAERGDLYAKAWLGDAYRTGIGVQQDFAKAIELSCAAANGDTTGTMDYAMNSCGYGLLVGGPGVTPNLVESLKWLTLAVERSVPGDTHNRATMNLNRALAQANPQQIEDARQRAEEVRTKWRASAATTRKPD
jgi:TPR repeat protein